MSFPKILRYQESGLTRIVSYIQKNSNSDMILFQKLHEVRQNMNNIRKNRSSYSKINYTTNISFILSKICIKCITRFNQLLILFSKKKNQLLILEQWSFYRLTSKKICLVNNFHYLQAALKIYYSMIKHIQFRESNLTDICLSSESHRVDKFRVVNLYELYLVKMTCIQKL